MLNFIKHIHIKQRSPFQTHLCKVLVPEEQAEWSEGCKDQHRRDCLVQPRHRLKVKVVCYISRVICTRSTAVRYCEGIVRVMLRYCQVFKRIPGRTVSLLAFKKYLAIFRYCLKRVPGLPRNRCLSVGWRSPHCQHLAPPWTEGRFRQLCNDECWHQQWHNTWLYSLKKKMPYLASKCSCGCQQRQLFLLCCCWRGLNPYSTFEQC